MFLTFNEVPGFTADDAWRIEDAEAMALLAAPCLSGPISTEQQAAIRAVLRQALMRWKDAGSGAATQVTAGPFGQTIDTRVVRKGMFWPSEIAQLRGICGAAARGRAFEIDTAPDTMSPDSYTWTTPSTWSLT